MSFWPIIPLVLASLLAGCTQPAARLPVYLGSTPTAPAGAVLPAEGPLPIALVVVNDTTPRRSAPRLSPGALKAFAERVARQVSEELPVTVVTVETGEAIRPGQAVSDLKAIADKAGVTAVLLAVLSAVDDASPVQATITGGSIGVPGTRLEDFALVELALIDTKAGTLLATAKGRAQRGATLTSLPYRTDESSLTRRGERPIAAHPDQEPYDAIRLAAATDAAAAALQKLGERLTGAR